MEAMKALEQIESPKASKQNEALEDAKLETSQEVVAQVFKTPGSDKKTNGSSKRFRGASPSLNPTPQKKTCVSAQEAPNGAEVGNEIT